MSRRYRFARDPKNQSKKRLNQSNILQERMDQPSTDPNAPMIVNDIVGNRDLYNNWVRLVGEENTMNVLWYGPPGCGKSLFWRLALHGHSTYWYNCIGDPGLRDIRDSIRSFCRGGSGVAVGGVDGTKLRYLILEHADYLFEDAQAFLRRLMETTGKRTRFILEARNTAAITEPILSRCMCVSLQSPDMTEIRYECLRRNPRLSTREAECIANAAHGNVRWAVLRALAMRGGATLGDLGLSALDKLPVLKYGAQSEEQWLWATTLERITRDEGLDPRRVIRRATNNDKRVEMDLRLWERPGGICIRALMLDVLGRKYSGNKPVRK